MTIRLIIAYLLNLFDLVMTTYWVNKFGIDIEGNPIGRWMYQTGAVYFVKVVLMAILFWLLDKAVNFKDIGHSDTVEWWDIVSWVILAVYAVLGVYHIIIAVRLFLIVNMHAI